MCFWLVSVIAKGLKRKFVHQPSMLVPPASGFAKRKKSLYVVRNRGACSGREMLQLSDHGHAPNFGQSIRSGFGLVSGQAPLLRIASYLANFGLSKAVAFLAPLTLAAWLDSSSYGVVEYAWSWSVLGASLLTLGVPAAMPQLSLRRRPVPVVDVTALWVAGSGALLTAAALAAFVLHATAAVVVLGACTIALAQVSLSSYTRTFSHRNLAPWCESLSVYVMTVLALGLLFAGLSGVAPLGITTTVAAAVVVIAALTLFARQRQVGLAERLYSAIRLGLPLLAFTLASIWASASGRIFIGGFLSVESLSIYSVDFRLASALLVLHSVVATGLFARLYRMPARAYDRLLSIYLAALAIVAVTMIAVFPFVIRLFHFRSLAPSDIPAAVDIFPIVALQVYAWGAWASLEVRLARTRRSAPAARRAIVLMGLVAALCVGLGARGLLSLHLCAMLVALQMLGGVGIQVYTLWRRGAKMPRTIGAIGFGTVLITASIWIIGSWSLQHG
jgi:O-antigen/teichoic acid export membrane protein